jgi:DNA invertase Pin-like site-specific DNA recombinase
MKKAIIYCRSATANEEAEMRLFVQASDCFAYAQEHDYEVLKVISEMGIGGLTLNREGLQKLLFVCHNNEIDAVIVPNISRLSRNREQLKSLFQTFANTKVGLIPLSPKPFLDIWTYMSEPNSPVSVRSLAKCSNRSSKKTEAGISSNSCDERSIKASTTN